MMHPHRRLVLLGLALAIAIGVAAAELGHLHHDVIGVFLGILAGILMALTAILMMYPRFYR